MHIDDNALWWLMVGTAIVAAGVSILATMLDRRAVRLDRKTRFRLHLVGYGLMTVSVLIFVLRGLLLPS